MTGIQMTPFRHVVAALAVLASAAALAHGDAHSTRKAYNSSHLQETALGHEGNPKRVRRVIHVTMGDDMRFAPSRIEVKAGDTVKFLVTNRGQMLHEMVLGTADELKKHAELMRRFPNMVHEDANLAHVQPGKSGDIVWTFTKPGEYSFACLQPGHFEAGMVGAVLVR